jgi:hypothetical protein
MRTGKRTFLIFVVLLVAGGCVTIPSGPRVMVLPPPDKPFDLFQTEDIMCRQWSQQQIGLTPQEIVNKNTAAGAAIGTAVGAGLGAALGAASGNVGSAAAFGAVSGLLIGTATGANSGQVYGWQAQHRYDIAYQQCMSANGNLIPGMRRSYRVRTTPPPPPLSGMESVPPDIYQPHVAPPPPQPFQPLP